MGNVYVTRASLPPSFADPVATTLVHAASVQILSVETIWTPGELVAAAPPLVILIVSFWFAAAGVNGSVIGVGVPVVAKESAVPPFVDWTDESAVVTSLNNFIRRPSSRWITDGWAASSRRPAGVTSAVRIRPTEPRGLTLAVSGTMPSGCPIGTS